MIRSIFASLLLIVWMTTGCAQRCGYVGNGSGTSAATAPQPPETRADRVALSPDLSAMSSYQAVDQALSRSSPPPQYRVLRATEVQCLAATNAPLGNLYDSESRAVMANRGHRSQRSAAVTSQLMAYRAVNERNKAAAAALQLYYLIAEAEANRDILNRSVVEIDRATGNLDQLKQSGLKIPLDRTALQRQKLDWLDQQIQMRSAFSKMQGQLQQLCGFEGDQTMPIWPQADLAVTVVPIDLSTAICDGLANRADLGAVRMLNGSLDADTLPAARAGMEGMSPGLGASIAGRRLLGGGNQDDLPARQAQVSQAQSDLERTVRREVAEAVENVEMRLREIAVAKERWEVWRQRMSYLQGRRESDGVTAFDLNAGQLELLRAESDTVHRVIAWKIAEVKLKEAQGLLAVECGYCVSKCCQ